jgi:hypothetical protein
VVALGDEEAVGLVGGGLMVGVPSSRRLNNDAGALKPPVVDPLGDAGEISPFGECGSVGGDIGK